MVVTASDVLAACESCWDEHKGDCSGFVRAVAKRVGIDLQGNADAIVDQLRQGPWTPLGDGAAACRAAERGLFVVGGLKGADQAKPSAHGHVVVVVPGPLAHEKYPSAYWGQLGGVGRKSVTLNFAWRKSDRDKVAYAAFGAGEPSAS